MKYIRTQGGIYEVIEECFKPMENNMVFIPGEGLTKILKQSDTIEELCDEFVGVRKSDNTSHLGKIENKYWFHEQTGWIGRVENYKVIYGAIWTDKGLIYVAKMN